MSIGTAISTVVYRQRGMHLRGVLKKACRIVIRILFPAPLVAIQEHGLQKKLISLLRHELRAHSSPVKLSLSLSMGVFLAILPIHGLQVVATLLLTFLFHLNRPIAIVGVSISSAPFLPFWIAAGVGVGEVVVPSAFALSTAEIIATHLPPAIVHCIKNLPVPGMLEGVVKWFFGSILLAVLCGIATFGCSLMVLKRMPGSTGNGKEDTAP